MKKNIRYKAIALMMSLATMLPASSDAAKTADYRPADYAWTTQSMNSAGSMPCGGHDVGMNVWVEKGDVVFYLSKSGMLDENNTLLKAGRFRLTMDGQPFDGTDFEQGSVSTTGLYI